MAPFSGIPSRQQQIALALAPKFVGALSIVGSSYIIYDCLLKKRCRETYHRLLVGMSVFDIMMSAGFVASTWAMPRDTEHVYGAIGTTATCELVGFLEQGSVGTLMYNGALAVYYLLRIRCGWKSHQIQKYEWCMHAIPILFALGTMIAGLQLNLYNSGLFDCWIAPLPQGCDESWKSGGDVEVPCIRGDNASLYQWIFDLIPKYISIFLVTFCMWFTYRGVVLQEKKSMRFRFHNAVAASAAHKNKLTVAKRLARQSYLYVGALYISWVPVIITRITEQTLGHVYYGMLLTISLSIPLQGFWNAAVYLRPRILQNLKEQRERNNSSTQLLGNSWRWNASKKGFTGKTPEQELNSSGQSLEQAPGSEVLNGQRNRPVTNFIRAVSTAVRDGDLSDSCLSDDEGDEEPDHSSSMHSE